MVLAKEARQEPLSLSMSIAGQSVRCVIEAQRSSHANSRMNPEKTCLSDTLCEAEPFLLGIVSEQGWETECVLPLETAVRAGRRGRTEHETPALAFLERILAAEHPLASFCAVSIWDAYLTACALRDMDSAARWFRARAEQLAAPFLPDIRPPQDASVTLSFMPDGTERVSSAEYPALLLTWCRARLSSQGQELRRCTACGRPFLSTGPRNLLCSEACRKRRAKENKLAYDSRAKESGYEILYKNACQHWRNRIRRAEKAEQSELAAAVEAFAAFRQEALSRKKRVKEGTVPQEQFAEWLTEQAALLDTILP